MKPMTFGEKLIWAATFADSYQHPFFTHGNILTNSINESYHVIRNLRENINKTKTALGEDSEVYQMLLEMLKD